MEVDFWKVIASIVAVVGFSSSVCGLIADVPNTIRQLLTKAPKLAKHPNTYWVAFHVITVAVILHFIWAKPEATPATTSADPVVSKPTSTESPPVVVPNHATDKMGREFLGVLNTVATTGLSESDTKFYSEYLSATIPAKIEEICGRGDRDAYTERLNVLKEKSSSIQLQCRGLAPFFEKRMFQSQIACK